jgi:dihydrofolate synthase/folylpolyglutamate synthase
MSTPLLLALHGNYQLQNAATVCAAVASLRGLGYHHLDPAAIRDGLRQVWWPGRFEVLGSDPIIIADGAHTPHSMRQLCESLEHYFCGQRLHFVVGILRDKDARGMLEAIDAVAESVTLCDMPLRRATPADQLLGLWNQLPAPRVTPMLAASLPEALPKVRALAGDADVICITGSLHLVAEAEDVLNAPIRP